MIRTTCPQCGREDAIADYLASLPVMCKSCGHRVTMGESIAPTKPVLGPSLPPPPKPAPPSPPPPVVVAPPKPQPVVAVSLPPTKPEPAPLPVKATPPSDSAVSLGDKPLSLSEQPTYPLTPRAAFLQASGPGMVDLFEDVPIVESRTERPPLPPLLLPPAPVSPPSAVSFHRGRRLAARLVTLLGVAVALFAGVMLAAFAPNVVKNDKLMSTLFLFAPVTLYALYNVVLLGTQGQDFGKRALKLRVVGDDGTPAKFGRAFLKRELVVILLLAGVIPLAWKLYQFQTAGTLAGQWQRVGWKMYLPNAMPEVMPAIAAVLFSLMNALMIFNKDGKCIHDRLAKTTVTRAG